MGQGLSNYADSAKVCTGDPLTPCSPCGVRRLSRATPSAASPFWAIAVAKAVLWKAILARLGTIWNLGCALSDHGSSRKHAWWSGIRFLMILGGFRDPILTVFGPPRANFSFSFLCLFQGFFLHRFVSLRLGLPKHAFGSRGIAKTRRSHSGASTTLAQANLSLVRCPNSSWKLLQFQSRYQWPQRSCAVC